MSNVKDINILCIDDNKNNLFTLSELLKTVKNLNPITALSGEEGLKILLKQRIDLILLDIQMPKMNGFEVAKLVKSNKKTKDIPIVFITAVFKQDEFVKEGFEIGAIDYLTKPIDDNQLLNKISLYTKIFDQNRKLIEKNNMFYSIAQSVDNGIYLLDRELKTTFINEKALKLLGYKEKELVGKRIHNFIHYKDEQEKPIALEECPIAKIVKNGGVYKDENVTLIKKDGTYLPVKITATQLEENGQITGCIVYFKDITDKIRIKRLRNSIIHDQMQFIDSLLNMIEERDTYTAGHTKRVSEYCVLIAKQMGYGKDDIELLEKAAMLHDIGKISTPDSILLKPGKLNKLEYKLIKEHVSSGYAILSKIDSYKEIASIMYQHHEKYDGSGYPNGLRGDQIQPLSRIMIVADSFDAMTTNRVYKAKKSVKDALKEIESLSGKFYHPEVVNVAIEALKYVDVKENISQLPSNELEKERFRYFYKDKLTGVYDLEYLYVILIHYIESKRIYIYIVSLKNFTKFNNKFGWDAGDTFLKSFAIYLRKTFKNTSIFRVKGDDFLILSENKLSTPREKIAKYTNFLIYKNIVSFDIEEKLIKNKDYFLQNNELEKLLETSSENS